jgi:hypothetical protein
MDTPPLRVVPELRELGELTRGITVVLLFTSAQKLSVDCNDGRDNIARAEKLQHQ